MLDLAGRIIRNPDRAMVSLAGKLALAYATETFWALALSGHELARLHRRRVHILSGDAGDQGDLDMDEIERRMDALAQEIDVQMAALGGETNTHKQEQTDGSGN